MSQQSKQTDLFGAPEEARIRIPDTQSAILRDSQIAYENDFISEEEERALLQAIDQEPWMTDLRRRVQHYGYRYDYSAKWLSEEDRIGDLPHWSLIVADRLVEAGLFDNRPHQLIVNEYQPGQGIAPHIDKDCFGPVVAAISLGSDCIMKIYPPNLSDKDALDFVVLKHSMMAYRGIGRYNYRHGLPPRKSDEQDGVRIPRSRRVSLTFRTVKN